MSINAILLSVICQIIVFQTLADNNGVEQSKNSEESSTSIFAQFNREKELINENARRSTLRIVNDQADPFEGNGIVVSSHGTGIIVEINGHPETDSNAHMIVFTNKHVVEITESLFNPSNMSVEKAPDFLFRRILVAKKIGNNKIITKAPAEILFISPIYDFAVLKVYFRDLGKGAI
ncbi:MAG: hypothetical protein KDD40_09170, partial [Bdellovibrionales bacterium]|nr:hypothetical protein [Bdellovibrionales bacterium]